MSHIKKFILEPYLFAENNNISVLVDLATKADKAYYNTDKPILTDKQYDLLTQLPLHAF